MVLFLVQAKVIYYVCFDEILANVLNEKRNQLGSNFNFINKIITKIDLGVHYLICNEKKNTKVTFIMLEMTKYTFINFVYNNE